MREGDGKATEPAPMTSDTIGRAVEFLFQFVIRWVCFGLAGTFSLLSIVAWSSGWTLWLAVPLLMLTLLTWAIGVAIRPQGKFHSDRYGPSIIVPTSRAGGEAPND